MYSEIDAQSLLFSSLKPYISVQMPFQPIILANNRGIYIDNTGSYMFVAELPDTGMYLANYVDDLIYAINENIVLQFQPLIFYQVQSIYNRYSNLSPDNLIYYDDTIRENEEFSNITKFKKDDGAGIFRFYDNINKQVYGSFMFLGFLKLNKGDKLKMEVYKTNEPSVFIIHYIQIRKNITYHIYTRQINPYQ